MAQMNFRGGGGRKMSSWTLLTVGPAEEMPQTTKQAGRFLPDQLSWRRGMPNVWHYFFYPVGLLEEMPTSHKQLTKSHPPWLVEPLLL